MPPEKPIARLFEELGRTGTDRISLSYYNDTTEWTSQQVQVRFADALAATFVDKGLNVYLMVNPTDGVLKGRGAATSVTALSALWADLDYKDGGLADYKAAVAVIDMLSSMINCQPVAIVHSGHGLQPYWAVEDGQISDSNRNYIMGVLKRWGQLVERVAEMQGGHVDSVYDLPRVLRAPGTVNFKDPSHPEPSTIEFTGWSRPLTILEIVETVEAYGFLNENLTVGEFNVVAPPADWEPAEKDCVWAAQLFGEIASVTTTPKSRHAWLVGKATRLEVAARNGCVTEATYEELVKLLSTKFEEILATSKQPRPPAPGEVSTAFAWARQLVSTFSDTKMADNLNYHKHKAQLYAVPDLPKESATPGTESEFPTDGTLALAPKLVPITLGDQNFQFTDAANSERLAEAAMNDYRFVPGLGWYTWDGGRYVPDQAKSIIRLAIAVARNTALTAPSNAAMTWANKSMSAGLIAAAVRLAESVPEMVALPASLDAEGLDLCTPGGIVDLTTGTLRPASPLTDLNTRQANFTPEFGAPHPQFDKFLHLVLEDDERIAYMQALFGVALIGELRFHILPIFSGVGANGKSALLDIGGKILGDYYAVMPENFLLDGAKVEHSTEIFRLRGVRLAAASETRPDGKFNESRVKMLTAEPVLSARAMRENFVDFPATHTLFLALNHPPTVRSGGDGFWRRIRKIDFNYQIPKEDRNPNFSAEIVEAEGPAILAWMVEGARRVLQEGLIEPRSVEMATEQYRSEEDHIDTWMKDCVEVNAQSVLSSNSIYASYVGWCKVTSESPLPVVAFFRDLRQRTPMVPTKTGRERGYKGLYLYDDREGDSYGTGRRY